MSADLRFVLILYARDVLERALAQLQIIAALADAHKRPRSAEDNVACVCHKCWPSLLQWKALVHSKLIAYRTHLSHFRDGPAAVPEVSALVGAKRCFYIAEVISALTDAVAARQRVPVETPVATEHVVEPCQLGSCSLSPDWEDDFGSVSFSDDVSDTDSGYALPMGQQVSPPSPAQGLVAGVQPLPGPVRMAAVWRLPGSDGSLSTRLPVFVATEPSLAKDHSVKFLLQIAGLSQEHNMTRSCLDDLLTILTHSDVVREGEMVYCEQLK